MRKDRVGCGLYALLARYSSALADVAARRGPGNIDKRLLDFLKRQPEQPVGELVHGIQHAVREFAAGAEQSDDLTLLALGFSGR